MRSHHEVFGTILKMRWNRVRDNIENKCSCVRATWCHCIIIFFFLSFIKSVPRPVTQLVKLALFASTREKKEKLPRGGKLSSFNEATGSRLLLLLHVAEVSRSINNFISGFSADKINLIKIINFSLLLAVFIFNIARNLPSAGRIISLCSSSELMECFCRISDPVRLSAQSLKFDVWKWNKEENIVKWMENS